MSTFAKDPADVLDYTVDWSAWLAVGETISTSAFTVASGITLDSESNTTTTATAWISGGTAGTTYTITSQITTSAARTAERSFTITARQL